MQVIAQGRRIWCADEVRVRKSGLPRESRESFALLGKAGVLDGELSARLQVAHLVYFVLLISKKP
jgi:hypothetical protein